MDKHGFIAKAVRVFDELGHRSLVEHIGHSNLTFDDVRAAIDGERIVTEDFHNSLCELSDEASKVLDE